MSSSQTAGQAQYPCSNCGANVEFAPGTAVLQCPYCGAKTEIPQSNLQVREHNWAEFAGLPRKPVATLAAHTFTCRGCAAITESDKLSDRCQFCGAPLVLDGAISDMVTPEAVLPFQLDKPAMRQALQGWAKSRWFAPNSLKKVTSAETARTTYLPHWTYDARTVSEYTGERGEHYWETEWYQEDGETKSRQVQKTAWYPTSGQVSRDFDDVLVAGTTKVAPGHLDTLDPWPLLESQPFTPEYLAGHETLRYDVEPEAGLGTAKERMAPVIQGDCRTDIGGDEQRVSQVSTEYHGLMFKLMLLPVWVACYLHAGKTYQVLVNGRTGEVAGERPYSKLKIAMAILGAIVAIALFIVVAVLKNHHSH